MASPGSVLLILDQMPKNIRRRFVKCWSLCGARMQGFDLQLVRMASSKMARIRLSRDYRDSEMRALSLPPTRYNCCGIGAQRLLSVVSGARVLRVGRYELLVLSYCPIVTHLHGISACRTEGGVVVEENRNMRKIDCYGGCNKSFTSL